MSLAAVPIPAETDKSAGAFRTIGEVAEQLDVSQHVLRFWETRFGQIRPLKRAGGRRYYRPEDVELVAGIRHLLHERRYTIAGAQRVLKENGVRFVQAVGRGEAVAAAPVARETSQVVSRETSRESDAGLDAGARAALEAALRELHDCRDLLAALRMPPAPDA